MTLVERMGCYGTDPRLEFARRQGENHVKIIAYVDGV